MTEDNISWTSFCQAMNSIAFWLIQNKKKYKKRDYYQIFSSKLCNVKELNQNRQGRICGHGHKN